MYNWLMFLAALGLVGLNALFVAAEFAWVKVMRVRIEMRADAGDKRAKQAMFGINNLDAYLSVCQLGITLASLALGWIGEPAVAGLLGPIFALLGIENPVMIHSISLITGFLFITFLHVIFGELAPKSLSIQRSESVVLFLAYIMRFFYLTFFPFVKVLNGTSNLFLRLFGVGQAGDGEHSHTSEELQMLIVDSQKSGHIDEQEKRLLSNVFLFDRRDASDAMVHRVDVTTISIDETVHTAIQKIKKTGHTRYPVYKDDHDNIVGFINIKDLVDVDDNLTIKSFVRKPFYAFESASLDDLMFKMQKNRQQFAIVIDEYGSWEGIITMEDMLEVIVGDLKDEHDIRESTHIQEQDGFIKVLASTSADELYEYLELEPEEQSTYKTVAGLFLEKFGMMPEQGDSVIFNGYKLTVSLIDGKRIKELEVLRMYYC